jgi:hypothetical protein
MICAFCLPNPGSSLIRLSSSAPDGPLVELGKRYTDDDNLVEILCVKASAGPLAIADRSHAENGQAAARIGLTARG